MSTDGGKILEPGLDRNVVFGDHLQVSTKYNI